MRILAVRMKDLHRSWGRHVRDRRKLLGMTQEQLAELALTTQVSVSRIERGDQCPSDELKWRLANALRSTLEDLFAYPPISPSREIVA